MEHLNGQDCLTQATYPLSDEHGPERPEDFRQRVAASYTAERALHHLRVQLENDLNTADTWAQMSPFPGSGESWQRWVHKAAWLKRALEEIDRHTKAAA